MLIIGFLMLKAQEIILNQWQMAKLVVYENVKY